MSGEAVGRFAPSPSGRLHLGNLACSLLAWLSAKSQGGRVVLRSLWGENGSAWKIVLYARPHV